MEAISRCASSALSPRGSASRRRFGAIPIEILQIRVGRDVDDHDLAAFFGLADHARSSRGQAAPSRARDTTSADPPSRSASSLRRCDIRAPPSASARRPCAAGGRSSGDENSGRVVAVLTNDAKSSVVRRGWVGLSLLRRRLGDQQESHRCCHRHEKGRARVQHVVTHLTTLSGPIPVVRRRSIVGSSRACCGGRRVFGPGGGLIVRFHRGQKIRGTCWAIRRERRRGCEPRRSCGTRCRTRCSIGSAYAAAGKYWRSARARARCTWSFDAASQERLTLWSDRPVLPRGSRR